MGFRCLILPLACTFCKKNELGYSNTTMVLVVISIHLRNETPLLSKIVRCIVTMRQRVRSLVTGLAHYIWAL